VQLRLWPRTIRRQMLAGVVLLEIVSLLLFSLLLVNKEHREIHRRVLQRMAYQANLMTLQAREALLQNQPSWIGISLHMMAESPALSFAKVTDPSGATVFVSEGDPAAHSLDSNERCRIPHIRHQEPLIFDSGKGHSEVVEAIYTGNQLRGYVWLENEPAWDRQQLHSLLNGTILFGLVWLATSVILVLLLSRTITRPLATLHSGTQALMQAPEKAAGFPLKVSVSNELGDLVQAFNRMVASIEEQRAGLNDTLSLLDSMLAHAPIGLAFFDHEGRFVRVNQLFATLSGSSIGSHLGRRLGDLMAPEVAIKLSALVDQVFAEKSSVQDLEIGGDTLPTAPRWGARRPQSWNWMVSAYPVRTPPGTIRWVGMIVVDTSQRKRNEEALRKSEKLAATGRLAASIAHEINNPLEAITNLIYLLSNFCQVDDAAKNYLAMADNEARRISEITQQTLRFYRQQSQPAMVSLDELLGSVLRLFSGRISTHNLAIERHFEPATELRCFAGELRQVFANLVANAIDACPTGGRLLIRVRPSRNWAIPTETGLRFTFADTGSGMTPEIRQRAFEAFFTTKEKTGTGLGLWVSHEIILKHGGKVHLRSRQSHPGTNSGTVFEIFIPAEVKLPTPSPSQQIP